MRATIRDVAREAGVSIATVSRVMHEHEHVSTGHPRPGAAAASDAPVHPQPARPLAGRAPARRQRDRLPRPVRPLLRRGGARLRVGRRRARPLGADPLDPRPRRRPDDGPRDGRALRRHGRHGPDRPRRAAVERLAATRRHSSCWPARPSTASTRSRPTTAPALARSPSTSWIAAPARLVLVGDASTCPPTSPSAAPRSRGCSRSTSTRRHHARRPRRGRRRPGRRRLLGAPCPTPSSAPTTSSRSACSAGWPTAGVDIPGRVLVTGWDDIMAARYAGLTTVRQPMREPRRDGRPTARRAHHGHPHPTPPRVLPTELSSATTRPTLGQSERFNERRSLSRSASVLTRSPSPPASSSPAAAATTTPEQEARREHRDRQGQGQRHDQRLGDGHRGREARGVRQGLRDGQPRRHGEGHRRPVGGRPRQDLHRDRRGKTPDVSLIGTTWMGEFAKAGGLDADPGGPRRGGRLLPRRLGLDGGRRHVVRRPVVRRDPGALLPHRPGQEGRVGPGADHLGRACQVRART